MEILVCIAIVVGTVGWMSIGYMMGYNRGCKDYEEIKQLCSETVEEARKAQKHAEEIQNRAHETVDEYRKRIGSLNN